MVVQQKKLQFATCNLQEAGRAPLDVSGMIMGALCESASNQSNQLVY